MGSYGVRPDLALFFSLVALILGWCCLMVGRGHWVWGGLVWVWGSFEILPIFPELLRPYALTCLAAHEDILCLLLIIKFRLTCGEKKIW